jgi:hypothetical protein
LRSANRVRKSWIYSLEWNLWKNKN